MKTNIEIPKERTSGDYIYDEESHEEIFIENDNNEMSYFCEELEEKIQDKGRNTSSCV